MKSRFSFRKYGHVEIAQRGQNDFAYFLHILAFTSFVNPLILMRCLMLGCKIKIFQNLNTMRRDMRPRNTYLLTFKYLICYMLTSYSVSSSYI